VPAPALEPGGFLPWGAPLAPGIPGWAIGGPAAGGHPSRAGAGSLGTSPPPLVEGITGASLPGTMGIVLPGPLGLDLALAALRVDASGLLLPPPGRVGCRICDALDGVDVTLPDVGRLDPWPARRHGREGHEARPSAHLRDHR
jgi:hypothetical protein